MGNKLKVLFNSEFSASSSGIAKLCREMMGRLHQSGKYELAELAGICDSNDERIDSCPWKVYPTMPTSQAEQEIYNAHHLNSQGRWKFNETCLDFEPDVVVLTKDAWLEDFAHYFPFREFYHLVWWNPVDGEPLEPEWIAQAVEADACFTYTEWGANVLKEAAGAKGNILGAMPLGVNPKIFCPIFNKKAIKEHFGFNNDILVTGFVCRNQPRKLIACLMEAFTNFLLLTTPEIRNKSYLYLHTAWPDIGWNIPQLIKDYGIGNKVLLTYQCANCKSSYPTMYSDIGAICKNCKQISLGNSRTNEGISDEEMNLIYNFFDVYCQVSSAEGLGIPCIESIGCAVPTMVTDYSGTVDVINKAGAIPIKSLKLIREMETSSNRYMSMPDVEDLARNLHEIYSLPDGLRRKIGWNQYLKGKDWFNWDLAASIFMEYLDELPKKDWGKKPFRVHKPTLEVPNNLNVEEIMLFIKNEIIGRPEQFYSYRSLRQTYNMMMGIQGTKPNITSYSIKQALDDSLNDYKFYQEWERKRAAKFGVKI